MQNKQTDNSRNGYSPKTVRTSQGELQLEIPRDRHGEFEPMLIQKYQRDISQIEDKVLSRSICKQVGSNPNMTRIGCAKSMGRRLTKGELIEYYSRDDVCTVLYQQSKRWSLLMLFTESLLLEPDSESDTRRRIIDQIHRYTKHLGDNDRLPFREHGTIHMLRDRGREADVRYDFMLEEDPPSWAHAVTSLQKALDVLDTYGAFYRLKFSGHRSFHLIIPAEAFPTTFQGAPINRTLRHLQRRIWKALPRTCAPRHRAVGGLRALYSIHPISGMVSVPVQRSELVAFQPWMANIHTVAVDYGWLTVPKEAPHSIERFLDRVFRDEDLITTTSLPSTPGSGSVRAYSGDEVLPTSDVRNLLSSAEPQERIAGARAAFIQDVSLPDTVLDELARDPEQDVVWFAEELRHRRSNAVNVEQALGLLSRGDDYLKGLGHRMLCELDDPLAALRRYVAHRQAIDGFSVAAVHEMMFQEPGALEQLPERVAPVPLSKWFETMWIVCGSALYLRNISGSLRGHNPDVLFQAVRLRLESLSTGNERQEMNLHLDVLRELGRIMATKRTERRKFINLANKLLRQRNKMRRAVFELLEDADRFVAQAGIRLLSALKWDDSIDLLIQQLPMDSMRRKAAVQALVAIGEPVVMPVVQAIEQTDSSRLIVMGMEVLGRIGDVRALPTIRRYTSHPEWKIQEAARRVLGSRFCR